MQLTEHFHLDEFLFSQTAVRLGIDNTPDAETLENIKKTAEGMERIRNYVGTAIRISSGYRSEKLNAAIGGSKTSDHMTGNACDFTVRGMTPRRVAQIILGSGLKFDQLILEGVSPNAPNGVWIHIGFGDRMRGEVLTMVRNRGKTTYRQGLTSWK
jgi:hypothetical protein